MTSTTVDIKQLLQESVAQGVQALYDTTIEPSSVNLNTTRKEFEGDYTVVVFPFTKVARKKPDQIGEELGNYLVEQVAEFERFNVVKGFLNIVVSDAYWKTFLDTITDQKNYGIQTSNGRKVMVEFSSPNTNKPLHLGHIRNILLGWSTSKLWEANGFEVVKTQIVNDRGIAICKSMLAWQKFGNGATPESTATKSDHFVGKYYVLFEQKFQDEYKLWQASEKGKAIFSEKAKEGQDETAFFKKYKNQYFNNYSALGKEARTMLQAWEAGEETTVNLWKKMNGWVYEGFSTTYKKLGVEFDKLYYESDTYLLGKDIVNQGLEKGIFEQEEDGSVWADLTDVKMDRKIVLRSDGTAVYMTQDLGTAQLRYQDFGVEKMTYVVADEQDYHFKVLFELLKRMGEPYADGLFHLSYGMVDLPSGKMKSREGTVVDADDLVAEVIEEARKGTAERGDISAYTPEQQEEIIRKIGMAALKYFIIKVNPRKRMTFDPKESVDMQGDTGPYIQYSYVRIFGVGKKAQTMGIDLSKAANYTQLDALERDILVQLYNFPIAIKEAATTYDPSIVASFCYNLAKTFNKLWHDLPILNAKVETEQAFRTQLASVVGNVLKTGMDLLGIEMPERM